MREIPLGTKGSYSFTVSRDQLASSASSSQPPVLGTPVMSLAMELAAMAAIEPYLESGEISVGATMKIEHLAPTPEGYKVCAHAEVTKAQGRRIEFRVRAADDVEEIGTGTHGRAVLERVKFDERLNSKMSARKSQLD
jgi:fluoroacetyl-CoA thioesterase